ncbi:MAG: hypothetical protein Q7R96_03540 [Nanoarchaeota archaeon]|nr:hypothetical protein [Nanoarchaeota archaeon]
MPQTKTYQEHITSTDEHQVWLHRTHKRNIESILKHGLSFLGDLEGTATLQPRNLKTAEGLYANTHNQSDAVVVIKIPKQLLSKYQTEGEKGRGDYWDDQDLTYFHPERRAVMLQPQHIHGWIDKDTDIYHPNPYRETLSLERKHFPPRIYSKLEKRVQHYQPTKTKEKPKKLKPGQLPPPPKNFSVCP